jgi:hypothetical protein
MTPKQARVVDAVNTSIARGYTHVFAPIANILFPMVTVFERGGTVIEFGADDFRLVSSARAPGSNTKRIQFGHSGAPYALKDYSLEGKIPVEIGQEAGRAGIDQYQRTITAVQRMMDIERENEAGLLARNSASYAASNKKTYAVAGDRWDDPASDPVGDIQAGREAIRSKIGVYPDTLVVSPKAKNALAIHPDIIATLRDADIKKATLEQIARAVDVERIVVGDATYYDGANFVDIWGNDALLAYTRVATLADGGSPAFGYTYQLDGYPFVEESYIDRNAKSEIVPVTDARQPVLAGAIAGYLFEDVVS